MDPELTAALRAGGLVWWTNAVLRCTAAPDDAVEHVTGSVVLPVDVPSISAVGNGPATSAPTRGVRSSWPVAWGWLRRQQVGSVSLSLSAPGDPWGLSGSAEAVRTAVGVGLAVMAQGRSSSHMFVPGDAGVWRSWPTREPAPGSWVVGDARRSMREAMAEVVAAMKGPAWEPDRIALVDLDRARRLCVPSPPGDIDPRAADLVRSASTVWAIARTAAALAERRQMRLDRATSRVLRESRRALAVGFSAQPQA